MTHKHLLGSEQLALRDFLIESWGIEGYPASYVTDDIMIITRKFLQLDAVSPDDLDNLVKIYCPALAEKYGSLMRVKPGMDVRIGGYTPIRGGPEVKLKLEELCNNPVGPWECHIKYETLHPFLDGNGRSGRTLWAWQMRKYNQDPYALPFLQQFYYQTLKHIGR